MTKSDTCIASNAKASAFVEYSTASQSLPVSDFNEGCWTVTVITGDVLQNQIDALEARKILEEGDFLGITESEKLLANILNATPQSK
jgi:hypothetical protein